MLFDEKNYKSYIYDSVYVQIILSEKLIDKYCKKYPRIVDVNNTLESIENLKIVANIKKINKFLKKNFNVEMKDYIRKLNILTLMPNKKINEELGISGFSNESIIALKKVIISLGYNNYKYACIDLLKYTLLVFFEKEFNRYFHDNPIDINKETGIRTKIFLIDFFSEYIFANDLIDFEFSKRLIYFNKSAFRSLSLVYKRYSDKKDFIKYVFDNKELFIDFINENYENRKRLKILEFDNERKDI